MAKLNKTDERVESAAIRLTEVLGKRPMISDIAWALRKNGQVVRRCLLKLKESGRYNWWGSGE